MMSRKINHVRKKQNNKDRLETTCQEVPVGLKLGQLPQARHYNQIRKMSKSPNR